MGFGAAGGVAWLRMLKKVPRKYHMLNNSFIDNTHAELVEKRLDDLAKLECGEGDGEGLLQMNRHGFEPGEAASILSTRSWFDCSK